MAVSLDRLCQGPADGFAIFGMQLLQKALEINPLGLRESQQRAPLVGCPNFMPRKIANPDAEIRGLGGQGHLKFALPQFVGQLRRAQRIKA
jgi:hypothetical protein